MNRRIALGPLSALLLAAMLGCGGGSRGGVMPTSIDTTRALTAIDSREPFDVWLGRGSGRDGLETVYIGPRGESVLYRRHADPYGLMRWERASVQLTPSDIIELRTSIANHHLLALERVYQNGTADGTQWVLAIVQGDAARVTLFDNVFPEEAEGFAYDLDQILARRRLESLVWTPIADDEAGRHDDALWDATRR